MKITVTAADPKQGMTTAEIQAALVRSSPNDVPKILANFHGRIKSITIDVPVLVPPVLGLAGGAESFQDR